MPIAAPTYSKKQVNRAGTYLRDLRIGLREDRANALAGLVDGEFDHAVAVVEWWRSRHAAPLARVNAGLRYYIRKVGAEPQVSQRLKRFSTIVHKLDRERTMKLSSMEDIGGVRAILPQQTQILELCRRLERAADARWKIRRRRDYIDGGDPGPKDDGYRAVHLIIARDGCHIELQLRTPWQDVWAQSVEQDTRRLRADLKFGAGPDDLRQYYRLVSDLFWMRQEDIQPEQEFMEELAKLFAATRRYFPDNPDTLTTEATP